MTFDLDTHKGEIMLTKIWGLGKNPPKLTQVINRWISGVLITSCPPVPHQLSHLLPPVDI